jgi:Transposase
MRVEPWLELAADSLVTPFRNSMNKDEAAVRAAITSPWSNGQTEGQNPKLNLAKRQMYGRRKTDLLQACLIGASRTKRAARVRQTPFCAPIDTRAAIAKFPILSLSNDAGFLAKLPSYAPFGGHIV